jgi:hypothetical protein
VHESPSVAGKLEFVARGVERLVKWTEGRKIIWNCIECTHIGNPRVKATPEQVRAEVWMALIHGSRGLIYFVHQFEPEFREAALLDDAEMLAAVTAINRQISTLAPVLNSPTLAGEVIVGSSVPDVPIAVMPKRHANALYLFAVNLRDQPAVGTFALRRPVNVAAEVIGESRQLDIQAGGFTDAFGPYAVHLYRIPALAATETPP